MRFLLKEVLYVIAAICGIYSTIYILTAENWRCQMWALLGAALASYIGYKVSRLLLRRKNKELKAMAKRKKELELVLIGEKRLSSGYEPDDYV